MLAVFFYVNIIIASIEKVRINTKPKLKIEKSPIYRQDFPGLCFIYSRKVIKLAREAINVPAPPMLTPSKSSG